MSRCKLFCNFLNTHFNIILLLILIIVITAMFYYSELTNYLPFKQKTPNEALEDINTWFYFLAGAGTTILAGIAYLKSRAFYKQNEANLLLRIDERWGSLEIIKARIIIHRLYLRTKEKNERKRISKFPIQEYEDTINKEIGEQIIEMSEDKGKERSFIYLLNFLDFMETIGYLCSEKHITAKALNELCGESLKYNYQIFEAYIDYRNSKHTGRFYCEFKKLYRNIKKELDQA